MAHRGYIPTLDGWRALAVGAVMVSHAVLGLRVAPRAAALATTLGWEGVAVFFGISGLIITHRLLQEHAERGRISLGNFYLRRVWRIMPAAYLYFAVIVAMGWAGSVRLSSHATVAAALYYRNYVGGPPWELSHFWSLAVEEHFYLLWPAILVGLGARRAWRAAWALAAAVLFWRFLAIHRFHLDRLDGFWGRTDIRFDALLFGCVAAMLLAHPARADQLRRHLRAYVWWALALFWALLALRSAALPALASSLQSALIPLLLLGTVLHAPWRGSRWLEAPWLAWTGRISYSLYLWQQLFLGPDRGNWLPLRLAAIFACAALSYYLVERPAVAWAHRRWPGTSAVRAVAAASA